jgi:DNA (cytosine-5)-methyltransferase 1
MPKKNSYITVTDQFCGAGGSSQGVRRLSRRYNGGLEVKLALNHWKLAIETHSTNFPDTLHDCTDISASDPRRYHSTDILITSPECTTHSPAGGNRKVVRKQMDLYDTGKIDAAAERSRATMWDVCRYSEFHDYRCIVVENVVEARRWALFESWLSAMHVLGYDHKCIYHNSMHHHPTPQSRDRMYVVFWKKGNRAPSLDYMPVAYCPKCAASVKAVQTWKNPLKHFGKYRQQYIYSCPTCASAIEPYYFASFNCIDWSDPGTRIGNREKPLAPKTIARAKIGLKKYGGVPFQIRTQYTTSRGVTRPLTDVAFSQTTVPSTAFLVDDTFSSGTGCRVTEIRDALRTVHTNPNWKVFMPFIIKLEHGDNGSISSVADKFQTQTARHSQMMVNPLPTQTQTQGMGMIVPFLVENGLGGSARSIVDPVSTATASGVKNSLVTPPFLIEMYRGGGARKITDPLNTATAGGIKSGLITSESWNSFIQAYYGGSNVQNHITEPVTTISTRERHGLYTYKEPNIEDCYYRMLKPYEIKLAMAFDSDYIVLGSSRDQVKQLGNAVTPPVMEWIVQQCIESLN